MGRLRFLDATIFLSQITGNKQENIHGWYDETNLFSFLNGSTVEYKTMTKKISPEPMRKLQTLAALQGVIISSRSQCQPTYKPLWLIDGSFFNKIN